MDLITLEAQGLKRLPEYNGVVVTAQTVKPYDTVRWGTLYDWECKLYAVPLDLELPDRVTINGTIKYRAFQLPDGRKYAFGYGDGGAGFYSHAEFKLLPMAAGSPSQADGSLRTG